MFDDLGKSRLFVIFVDELNFVSTLVTNLSHYRSQVDVALLLVAPHHAATLLATM